MRNTLIVCEKPDSALRVAEALSTAGRPKKHEKYGAPYFELRDGEDRILVCSALGHLYGVDVNGVVERHRYPVWDFRWKPKHLVERRQRKQELWLRAIDELAGEADNFINACDYDIEGSLIGYMILRYACRGADAKARRMKFSTLTTKELRESYANLMPQLDYPLVNAGMCRHEVDWLYGINLSRALTEAAHKQSGKYATLSTGRVQGPTLQHVVEREMDISTFVPAPYWAIRAIAEVDGHSVEAEYSKEKIETRSEAEKIVSVCSGKLGKIKDLESRQTRLSPPHPFDLASLQAEAYRHFGFTPSVSLGIAERLYLDALISYPRTSSQKLPPTIGYAEILGGLSNSPNYRQDSQKLLSEGKLFPNEGKKADPAHPAIYPTGNLPKRKLDSREQKVFDLVVRRFMSTFGRAAIRRSEKATIDVEGYIFFVRASRTVEGGWIEFYNPYAKFEETSLPPLTLGGSTAFREVLVEDKLTQPPPRFNPSSLLHLMEEENIGTKATRAEIIDTLYRRGYIRDERIVATSLASKVIKLLGKYCPKIIEVNFTRELEEMMHNIELGTERRENVVLNAVEHLKPIIEELKARENEIGRELSETIREIKLAEITFSAPCPNCGSKLFVLRSKRTGKRFVGCSGRWEGKCSFSLPLPQFGKLRLLERRCKECGFQLVQVKTKGRRPMISCSKCYVEKAKGSLREAAGT